MADGTARTIRRWALRVLAGLGLTVVFVVAFAAAVVLHLDTVACRRAVATVVSRVVTQSLRGSLEIHDIRHLGLDGVRVGRVELRDVSGRVVLSASDVQATMRALVLARDRAVDRLLVGRVDVTLFDDGGGVPSLVDALGPRTPAPKGAPSTPPPRFALRTIDVDVIDVHGAIAGRPVALALALHRAGLALGPEGTKLTWSELDAAITGEGSGLPASIELTVKGGAVAQSPGKGASDVDGVIVEAKSGAAEARVEGRFSQGTLDVRTTATLPEAELARWLPKDVIAGSPTLVPALGTVKVALHVQGEPSALVLDGEVATAMGSLTLTGDVAPSAKTGHVVLDARGLAPYRLVRDVPEGQVDVHAEASLAAVADGLALTLSGNGAPRDEASAGWFRAAKLTFTGDAVFAGAAPKKGALHVRVTRGAGDVVVDADLRARPSGVESACCLVGVSILGNTGPLEALPASFTHGVLGGSAMFRAYGTVDVAARAVDLNATVDAPYVRRATLSLRAVHVSATAKGPITAPTVHVDVAMEQAVLLAANGSKSAKPPLPIAALTTLTASADLAGDTAQLVARFDTDRGQHVSGAVTVERTAAGKTSLRALSTRIDRAPFVGLLTARDVTIDGQRLRIGGLRLSSTAGGARLDGVVSLKNALPETLTLATTDLDVGLLAHGLGLEQLPYRGTARLSAELGHGGPKTKRALLGNVSVVAKGTVKLPAGKRFPIDVDGTLSLDADQATLSLQAALANVLHVAVDGHTLALHDDVRAWLSAPGQLDVSIPDVDVARALAFARTLAPKPLAPGVELGGKGTLELHVVRSAVAAVPTLLFDVHTDSGELHAGDVALTSLDLDLHLDARPSADGAALEVATWLRAADASGELGRIDAGVALPKGLFHGAADGSLALVDVEGLPLTARLQLPARPVAKLPPAILARIPVLTTKTHDAIAGSTFGVDVTWTGPLAAPRVEATAELTALDLGPKGAFALTTHASYDGALAHVHAELTRAGKTSPLAFDADVSVSLLQAIEATTAAPPTPVRWVASADATVRDIPLGLFPAFTDLGLRGKLDADVHLAHLHDPLVKSPDLHVDARLVGVAVNGVRFESVRALGDVGPAQATWSIKANGAGGIARLDGRVPLAWIDATSPQLVPGADVTLVAVLKDLRLSAVAALVPGVDELDGRVDADLSATLAPPAKGKGAQGWSLAPQGTVSLHDGVLNVAAVGRHWEDIDAELSLTPQKVTLTKLVLHGAGGVGSAEVTGELALAAHLPTTLHLKVETDRFGIGAGGVPIGDVSGTIKVDGRLDGAMPSFTAVVDPMTVDLAPSSDKSPQELADEPSITVAQPIGPPKEPEKKSSAFAMELKVRMPNNVWVRRSDLLVALRGGPTIVLGPTPSYRGEVSVSRGRVDVFGKRFEITRARASFDGAADLDPALDIESTWTAPDDTIVTVTIGGRLHSPKLTLSASPSATEAQIVNLLALGRRDAGTSSDPQSTKLAADTQTAAIASAMTGAVLGGQLQRALPTNFSVSIKTGAQGFSDASVATGYQWKRVYFEVGYDAGAANAPPGAVTPSTTSARIEWRMFSHWSLMATLGDTGSSLVDLIWHLRY